MKKCNNKLVFLLRPQDRLVNEVRIELTVKFLKAFFSRSARLIFLHFTFLFGYFVCEFILILFRILK